MKNHLDIRTLKNPTHITHVFKRKDSNYPLMFGSWDDLAGYLEMLIKLNPSTLKKREFEIIDVNPFMNEATEGKYKTFHEYYLDKRESL